MKKIPQIEYHISRSDLKRISDMCEFCLGPYVDRNDPEENKSYNCFIDRQKIYTQLQYDRALKFLNTIAVRIVTKKQDMYEVINSPVSNTEKNMAQSLYDNYRAQARNITELITILTSEDTDWDEEGEKSNTQARKEFAK